MSETFKPILKPILLVIGVAVIMALLSQSIGCMRIRRLIFPESYTLLNVGAGMGISHCEAYCFGGSTIFDFEGPEEEVEYKDGILPIFPKLKIISKIDLPGKIISCNSCPRKYDLVSSDLIVIYQDGGKYYYAHLEESRDYDSKGGHKTTFKLLETSEIKGKQIIGINYKHCYFYIQSDDLRRIFLYNINGEFIKEYDLQKPSITTIIDYDDQERPIFLTFDGQRLFTFKDGETTDIMTLDTDNGISNAFFFEQTDAIPFRPPEYDLPPEKRSFDLVFYDGQYLHALSLTNKKTAFKIKIDGLKPGIITINYIFAPYKEGICLIDRDTHKVENLLKSHDGYRLLDYGWSTNDNLSYAFFGSYSKGKSTIKGWRLGEEKGQINTISIPPVNDKINDMTINEYLIFFGDKGVYYLTETYMGWRDIYW
ncbi:MAG TPA: hypothetical protein PL190_06855 [Caldisericia bacterium]|nr:hypothetical protein [Caldisericia bacterium]HNY61925.1 hypothetical protein [Caldisericia bacterium]HOC79988.1 hypothetical protein [Caldisericia bacterium]HOG70835.1 hypothetical protein [Caldisericia bacterium]HPA66225.1 hypothetical protein [Caldisericia bacterium]